MSSIYKLFSDKKIFILGHRGYSEKYPENTMLSFAACSENSKIDGVELDVHLAKSGEVVISHDFVIKRTSGLDIKIEDTSWSVLEDIDVGSFKNAKFSDARIPLLEEVFSTFGNRFIYDIELKVEKGNGKELCLKTWDLIQKYNLEENVMVSSFNPLALRRFNKAAWYSVPTADIFDESPDVPKILWHGFGHYISGSSYLKPVFKQVNRDFISKHNMDVITWTVNSREQAAQLLKLDGVKGLIGNDPFMLAEELAKIN